MDKIKKARIVKMYITTNGTLYKDSIVRVESATAQSVKVKDEVGKIFYVDSTDLVYIKY
tara:strand:- start:836 stop:1012 length:177 start_codon:yes stop_codon:yes gene_type:complete